MIDAALENDVTLGHARSFEIERELPIVVANDVHATALELREQQLLLDANSRREDADAQW